MLKMILVREIIKINKKTYKLYIFLLQNNATKQL